MRAFVLRWVQWKVSIPLHVQSKKCIILSHKIFKQEQLTRNIHSENISTIRPKLHMHFRTQIIAWQPISDNQVAACVFEACDFPYHPQSAPSSRTSNTPSVLQTLRSPLSRGTKHLAQSFIFLSGVPPQHCTGLVCTHIKYRIGILFFSNSCYFTFKVGHHWRTEHLFCLPISSDGGWAVSISPQV